MRRGGAGKRRDANEPELIAAARAVGAEVWQISGRGLPDLLVRFRGRLEAGEVKTDKGKLTEHQGDFPVWRSVEDVLRAIGAILVLLLLSCVPVTAQPVIGDSLTPAFDSPHAQKIADVTSWVTALTNVALDTKASWDNQNRARAFAFQGARLGITYGAVLIVKRLVHRTRPCSPACGDADPEHSFYSAHTALAFQTMGGPRLAFTLPLAVTTGGLRLGAHKHWLTDVLTGAGAGWLTSRVR